METAKTARSDFTTGLYAHLASTQAGQNLFFSPFSIRVALAMCAVGAKGETRRVLTELIGAPEKVDEQNRQYARLLESVYGEGKRPFQLVTANALWGQQGFHFNRAFQEAIADFYDGALHEVNFLALPDEAVRTINTWVSDRTGGKVQDLIRRDLIDRDTRLVLTNAIYFKGKWDGEFEKARTRDEDWHGPAGVRKVPMMHQRRGYLYCEADGFQALDLPYQGEQLSMLVVLPRKKDGLAALESPWAAGDAFRQVTDGLDYEGTVLLSMPRFKMETGLELKPQLCALGAEPAFSDDANFSGIGEERLKISEVVHKAFVEVDEEGTEAAAATGVITARCAGMLPTQPKVFNADHPFLFFIWDRNTNAVLFSGRVLDPR
jgi:serpin B